MSHEVYANGDEIAAASGMSKVTAAFPDVCMSPPSPPAGPIPVPYPNTSFSKDLQEGTTTVELKGKPAALSQQSYYKTSPLGDEAATNSFGASVMTHVITGKTYFQAWSMDVKMEDKNVCRHLDLTTSNHASYPGSTPPFPTTEETTQLVEERIKEKKCPCCGKTDCPAAFKDGETAQSMEDFYGLNATENGLPTQEAQDRMKVYQQMLGMKAKHCTCKGQVFPKQPCDVFRAPNAARTEAIEQHWTGVSDQYYTNYVAANPTAIADFVASNPGEIAPSNGPRWGKVNHLTPKGAGGCPDNPNNLQPHDLLCEVCKAIDDQFGRWQGRNANWRAQWREAFAKLKIKRFTVAGFTPPHW